MNAIPIWLWCFAAIGAICTLAALLILAGVVLHWKDTKALWRNW